jgi:hypothetical protein
MNPKNIREEGDMCYNCDEDYLTESEWNQKESEEIYEILE